ncbi:MAG: G1 family endopeptidase [Desulfosporosinus sp.]|nr:G1 family endopeptidase [Desulfosporosinus sp.]
MRIKLIRIVSLAVFVGLGTCSLVNGVPVLPATHNQISSAYVLTRNFPHRRLPFPQIQPSQGTATDASLPANTQESENWAGYIDTPATSSSYTSVAGSWTIPNISANQQNAAAAQWIGLGGVSSTDLLQMGTIEQIDDGQPVVEIFWEQLPSPAQYVMTVPIGSTINASIAPSVDSSSTWNLTFTVNGQSQTSTISPVTLDSSYIQGMGTSAEWISEDPSTQNNQLYPLATMGTTTYQSATINGQPLNSSANLVQPVAMVSSNGNILITPSALGTDGESFSTNVASANTSTSSTQVTQGSHSWRLVRGMTRR